jgi:hypothetical protein
MADEKKQPDTINFDYIKGTNFRVTHADGAFIALTPKGLTVNFYSERQAIPRRVVHKITDKGNVGEELKEQRVVRDAIIRDVDFAATMNYQTAKSLVVALDKLLKEFESVKEQK